MTIRRSLLLTALVVSSIAVAHAEPALSKPAFSRTVSPLFAALDSDHDGVLSAREIVAAPMTLATLDLNRDGVISSDEWQATTTDSRIARGTRTGVSFNLLVALDANQDGKIQAMEVANAVASLKQLDLNADGALTRDELRPVMVARN